VSARTDITASVCASPLCADGTDKHGVRAEAVSGGWARVAGVQWKEATQHQFVAIYTIGPTYNGYIEQTIFLKTRETLPQHQFIFANTTKERWGSVDLSASVSDRISGNQTNTVYYHVLH
jgi:hypothetical protein